MEYAVQDAFVLHEINADGIEVSKIIYKGTPIIIFKKDGTIINGHFINVEFNPIDKEYYLIYDLDKYAEDDDIVETYQEVGLSEISKIEVMTYVVKSTDNFNNEAIPKGRF